MQEKGKRWSYFVFCREMPLEVYLVLFITLSGVGQEAVHKIEQVV